MPKSYPQLDLDVQLCFALYAASRAVTRAYGPLLEEAGLTYPQYVTLLALWSRPDEPVTVGELGSRLRLDTGTLTPLLKRLEALGYINRARDVDDERRVLVSLTEAGLDLREAVASVPTTLFSKLDLDLAEGARLRTQLLELAEKVGS